MNEIKVKKVIRCLVVLAALLIVIISYLLISEHVYRSKSSGLTEVGPKINVLVIDDPAQPTDELFAHVQNGKAPLLLWLKHEQGSTQAYTFNTLESLVRLEQNKLGFLEANDPGLKNLYIAKYNAKDQTLSYESLDSQNISVIEASRNYLIGEILSDSKNNKNSAGKVIFTDGTTKELRMVKMPENQISEATLLSIKDKKI